MSHQIALEVLNLVYECNSTDIHSEAFKIEFKLRVQQLLHKVEEESKPKCRWCGEETSEDVKTYHMHPECYEGICQGEGLV